MDGFLIRHHLRIPAPYVSQRVATKHIKILTFSVEAFGCSNSESFEVHIRSALNSETIADACALTAVQNEIRNSERVVAARTDHGCLVRPSTGAFCKGAICLRNQAGKSASSSVAPSLMIPITISRQDVA